MIDLKCGIRTVFFLVAVTMSCEFANAQPGGPPGGGEEENSVPNLVDVITTTLNGSGLTNGVGYLQATANYTASRAAGEAPSTVTSSLTIDEGVADSTEYFDTTYSFSITQNQTCTWTLSSPTCNTLSSGDYRALAVIAGCGTFDFGEDIALLFD